MNELDSRKLDRTTLEEMPIRAVKRVETGESPEVVIKAMGLSRPRIHEWVAKYWESGSDALNASKDPGRTPTLSGQQLQTIYQQITGKNPLQLRFPFALWTCAMGRKLIQRDFGVSPSEVSVGRLLKKLGFTPRRPKWSAQQQNSKLVLSWMSHDFPKIQRMTKAVGASIYFGDESSILSDYHFGTTWAVQGKTPTVKATGARFRLNLISAVNSQGKPRFMITESNLTSDVFIEFLEKLLHDDPNPVFLIVDQHSVHRSKKVLDFVAGTNGCLRLFYLPPPSPEPIPTNWFRTMSSDMGSGEWPLPACLS